MAEESDAKMYQRTRDTLGKIIKKPPLNDRLLSRPPFRFLHDVIMEVRTVVCDPVRENGTKNCEETILLKILQTIWHVQFLVCVAYRGWGWLRNNSTVP